LAAWRVEVRVHPDNWRSRRVPEALGFTLRAQEAADEQPPPAEREELVVYALEPQQFRALPWARAAAGTEPGSQYMTGARRSWEEDLER
ncbi:MAG: hypothetical protein ACYC4L_14345, partial [Chloroflexota bacterium]